ncbi:MAG: hypothetical protein ACRDP6_14765 [Actinoallomurus sp.]
MHQPGELNLDAALTIRQLTLYFTGDVSYRCIDQWIRTGRITPLGKDSDGRVLIRLGDALDIEATTWQSKRGRPRKIPA